MSIHEKIDEFRQRLDRFSIEPNQGENTEIPIQQLLEELSTALEELQVMQEELQVQNEEIETSRAEAVLQSQRYQDLFQFAPDAYLITDVDYTIREANRAAIELLKLNPRFLAGKQLISFVCQRDRQFFRSLVLNVTGTMDFEICLQPRGSAEITAAVRIAPISTESDGKSGYRWILRDVTSEKHVQAALKSSEKRFRNIFHTASIGSALIDRTGQVVECNQALVDFLGADLVDDGAEPIFNHIHPDDRKLFKVHMKAVLDAASSVVRSTLRFQMDSGQMLWGMTTLSIMRFQPGEEEQLLLMVENITEQKRAMEEREEMQHRIIDSIEVERVHLARELHDNSLQSLYAVLFELENITNGVSDPESGERIKTLLLQVLNSLRMTCGELRPPTLSRYGLESAVSGYIETMAPLYTNLDIKFESDIGHLDLPERLGVTCYRVIQESLHNIFRHSQADQVVIRLKLSGDHLIVQVEDNGKGFEVPDKLIELTRDGHYGLAGLHERAQAVNGELKINSEPGRGTLIEMTVPVEAS
jgi:PAS domain S-box-containing protein